MPPHCTYLAVGDYPLFTVIFSTRRSLKNYKGTTMQRSGLVSNLQHAACSSVTLEVGKLQRRRQNRLRFAAVV